MSTFKAYHIRVYTVVLTTYHKSKYSSPSNIKVSSKLLMIERTYMYGVSNGCFKIFHFYSILGCNDIKKIEDGKTYTIRNTNMIILFNV